MWPMSYLLLYSLISPKSSPLPFSPAPSPPTPYSPTHTLMHTYLVILPSQTIHNFLSQSYILLPPNLLSSYLVRHMLLSKFCLLKSWASLRSCLNSTGSQGLLAPLSFPSISEISFLPLLPLHIFWTMDYSSFSSLPFLML